MYCCAFLRRLASRHAAHAHAWRWAWLLAAETNGRASGALRAGGRYIRAGGVFGGVGDARTGRGVVIETFGLSVRCVRPLRCWRIRDLAAVTFLLALREWRRQSRAESNMATAAPRRIVIWHGQLVELSVIPSLRGNSIGQREITAARMIWFCSFVHHRATPQTHHGGTAADEEIVDVVPSRRHRSIVVLIE